MVQFGVSDLDQYYLFFYYLFSEMFYYLFVNVFHHWVVIKREGAFKKSHMNEKIVSILYKRINGSIVTYDEELQLVGWIAESRHNRELYDDVMDPANLRLELQEMLGYDSKALWNKISRDLPSKENKVVPLYKKLLRYLSATVSKDR